MNKRIAMPHNAATHNKGNARRRVDDAVLASTRGLSTVGRNVRAFLWIQASGTCSRSRGVLRTLATRITQFFGEDTLSLSATGLPGLLKERISAVLIVRVRVSTNGL